MGVVRRLPWPWLPWLPRLLWLPWLLWLPCLSLWIAAPAARATARATAGAAARAGADDAPSSRRSPPPEIRHRQPAVRAEGFRKLADYPPMEAAKLLVQLGLTDREAEVRRAARETLRGIDLSGEAGQALLKSLDKRLRGPPDGTTALLIAAILESDAPMLQAELTNLLVKSLAKSKSSVPMLVAVADALGEETGPKALDPLKKLTRLPGYWDAFALRRATVQAIVRLDRPDAAEFLLQLLPTLQGEVRGDAVRYFTKLTGRPQDEQSEAWSKFWEKHRDSAKLPGELPKPAPAAKPGGADQAAGKALGNVAARADKPAAGAEKPAARAEKPVPGAAEKPAARAALHPLQELALGNAPSYYGLSIHARRLVFVIDISASMGGPRLVAAKRELNTAISRLPEDAEFNVIAFNDNTAVWQRNLMKANSWAKQSAIHFVTYLAAGGRTAAHDALEAAMRFDVEAVYFLTDGQPTAGRIVAPPAIVAVVRVANRFRRVSIYAIGIAPGPPGSPLDAFLRTLTEENYGQYRRVDQ